MPHDTPHVPQDEAMDVPLGHLMVQVFRLHRVHAHAALDALGLYRGQNFILGALWAEEGVTQTELAERVHVQPATITNSLKRMEQAGLVTRRPDPEDQRVSRVYLTEAGRELQAPMRQMWRELEAKTFKGFTLEERVLMRRFLLHIIGNLERDLGDQRGGHRPPCLS